MIESYSTLRKPSSTPKSTNIKILMREAKNDEKVEDNEREKRSRNIIIHGAEEVGESPEEIKKEDAQYISEILKEMGLSVKPNFITRLGVKSKDKNRPIKIVLKSKSDKDSVMKNLGRLKGTEDFFGKISVKDDYTTQERDSIRKLTERELRYSPPKIQTVSSKYEVI